MRRYWDSSVFLAWLLPEADRKKACREVLREAESGQTVLVTSALTLTEVIKLKGRPMLKEEQERTIQRFFLNDYIVIANVDRFIAEEARRLIWKHGVRPKDSIHVATALHHKITTLDTYDDDLVNLGGSIGNPAIRMGHPSVEQPDLPFEDHRGIDDDTDLE